MNKNAKNNITLRPYQDECEKAIESAGDGRHLVVLATGLGKTAIFTNMKRTGRVLILSHRDELVWQPGQYYEGKCSFGVEKAEATANGEDIVSASVQSLARDSRLLKYKPDAFDTIIIDEAHHAAAPTYRKILDYFSGARRRIGFTATPKRGDDVRLTDVFDDIIFNRDLRWGILNHYLAPIRWSVAEVDYSLKGVAKTAGDYNQSELERVLAHGNALPAAAKTYVKECHYNERHTLIYCVTKQICVQLYYVLIGLLPKEEHCKIKVLFGDTDPVERKQILADFASGEVRCIINCMVLTEGTDLPICDAVFNLRPTCNVSLYQQMVGRGTRLYPGKEYCRVFDFLPENSENMRNLCTAPTLFGVEPTLMTRQARQKFDEDQDLLLQCDELNDARIDEASRVRVWLRTIDAFVEEHETIIKENGAQGFKPLAAAYLKHIEEASSADENIDFGDLDVHIQSTDARYYKIIPSFDEEIYISKPDILDRVTIEFIIKGQILNANGLIRTAGMMDIHKAIEMATEYCQSRPEFCAYAWSKKAQDCWKEQPLTAKQKMYLLKAYKATVSESDIDNLNKLEACRLIDMSVELNNCYKERKTLVLSQSDKHTQPVQQAKETVKNMQTSRTHLNDELFKVLSDTLKQLSVAKKKAEAAARRKEKRNVDAVGPFRTCESKNFGASNGAASEKQLSFLQQLLGEARRRGFQFESPTLDGDEFTKAQAGMMIDFLLKLKNETTMKPCIFTDFEDILQYVRVAMTGVHHFHVHYYRPGEESSEASVC